MTPFGHAAVAYIAAHRAEKKDLRVLLLGSVLPDIDFLFLPFSFFNNFHRVATHNIFFLSVAAILGLLLSKEKKGLRAVFLFCGGTLHLFVDSIMDNNLTNGIGVALFYPLSEWMFSPFNLTPPVADLQGWGNLAEMMGHMGLGLAIELPFCLLALAIFLRASLWKSMSEQPEV